MKKIVIFGGSGFLGSYVSDECSRRGYEVVIADKFPSKYLQSTQTFKQVDISDYDAVCSIVHNAQIVYNFVAIANLEDAIHDPCNTMNINVMGNLNILEACRKSQSVERFVYASRHMH